MCVHGTRVIVTPSSFSSSANKKLDPHHSSLKSGVEKHHQEECLLV